MALKCRGKKGIYWYSFKFNGRRIHESSKSTKTVAREAEKARRRQLEESFNGLTRRTMPPAFNKASRHWQASREGRVAPATISIDRNSLAHLRPVFGAKLLCDITPSAVQAYQQARLKDGAQGRSINIETQTLRSILKAAKFWKHLEDEIHSLRERKDVGKALAPEEEARLLSECAKADSACFTAVTLALNTTLRSDEIKSLQWHRLDLFERILTVGKSKNEGGKGRTIPLNPDAMYALTHWAEHFPERQPEHYVFPRCESKQIDVTRPTKGWRTAWRNACKRAGLKVRFHDLRHSAITKLAESQASDSTIRSIAGHVSQKMLEHYSHIRMAAKRAALDGISTRTPQVETPVFEGEVHQKGHQIEEVENLSARKLLN